MRAPAMATAVVWILATGCVENVAPGNDREAALETPAPGAELIDATAALEGVAVGLVQPEIMTEADQGRIPAAARGCTFRMTGVGFPVMMSGSEAVVKLNGKLVRLPAVADGRFAAGGIEVSFRPLADPDGEEAFPAEFVLRLPGASHELGYRGSARCDAGRA